MHQLSRQIRRWQKTISDPRHLQNFEKSIHSQNGEDGMILEALKRLGIEDPKFVEFGASDGRENCTRHLLDSGGSGLWIEGNHGSVQIARAENSDKRVEIIEAFITIENITELISSSRVSAGFDLLVVDLDGNDWWLTRAILDRWSPHLIVAEFNPAFGPRKKWVMPYDAGHAWQNDSYYGSSLKGLEVLMNRHDYELVACDSRAVNSFWVKHSDTNLFTVKPGTKSQFVPALPGATHPAPGQARIDTPLTQEQLELIQIERFRVDGVKDTGYGVSRVRLRNNSDEIISSYGEYPIRLGLRCGDREEPVRLVIDGEIGPHRKGWAYGVFPSDKDFESIAVVQEGVSWGRDWTVRGSGRIRRSVGA